MIRILIPARGGSKRIPKKNLVDVNGKPLLQYTIETCRKITNEIYVSTEDKEIKEFAEFMNVNVIDRPERLATDESKTEDVVEHFLEEVDMNGDDLFCVVQPTSPLLHFNSILFGVEQMEMSLDYSKYDSIISVCEDVNYYWDSNGKPVNFELGKRKRTQEHQVWFKENGAFYITTKNNFLKKNILQNGNVGFVVMNEQESIDVDYQSDLEMVRRLCNY
jgi:CMP-N,N'-diacetyllegionaminic acid synthase